ncbi:hypothetical protein [Peptoniphilus vaginalis]|uniref:hypothetical protein n=1 Tax=Peptoniphilus vaginalis TaxID=1756987 RepID=UPI0023FA20B1|nr:hypothetical protein [Peptoniphilus vaginalis]
MRKLTRIIKIIALIRLIKPKRRRGIRLSKLTPILNPKRAGKVAYHAGRIKMRNEVKRLFY